MRPSGLIWQANRKHVQQEAVVKARDIQRLEDLPNIGPAIAAKLRRVGIAEPSGLLGRDPYALFEEIGLRAGRKPDPCLLDVLIAATRFMSGEPAKPWWTYTAERKAVLGRATGRAGARDGQSLGG